MITIDGSAGEGGGQILRSALTLSLVTGKPFAIKQIRGNRRKPGMMRQQLAAVQAAARISGAEVKGDHLHSTDLTFVPHAVMSGSYRFAIHTAGSCTLVLQTILPALLTAAKESDLILEGGTHNPLAPPFDFIERTFLPLINRMGPRVSAELLQPGFYPGGGGCFTVHIQPAERLKRLDIRERGSVLRCSARACLSRLPRHIGDRELNYARNSLLIDRNLLFIEELRGASGPGNVFFIEVESEALVEVFTGFGQRGVPAEKVAEEAVSQAEEYLGSEAPVGRFLADQLLIPMALAGGGAYGLLPPTRHTLTNIDIIRHFLDIHMDCREESRGRWEMVVG